MITVEIRRTKNHEYRGFLCMGHAGYAKQTALEAFVNRFFIRAGHEKYTRPGKPDVLCAAVSALTIGTANALEELAGEKLNISQNEDTGFFKCDFESVLQEKSNFLMDSMTFSLENISREYGKKYLQVKIKEV